MNDTTDKTVPVNSRLCYLSVVALFFALFSCIIPSPIRDVAAGQIFAFAFATISLINIKHSNGRLRGKGIAITAFAISSTIIACLLLFCLFWYGRYLLLLL